MTRRRPTVADLLATKGQRKMSMLYTDSREEAAAADAAGIDLLSISARNWTPEMREAAGACFVQAELVYGKLATFEEYLREAFRLMEVGADSCYCIASLDIIERLTNEGVPIASHAGLIPQKATWTGGFRAVGKTAETAMKVYNQIKSLESVGVIAVELEVVPDRVATEISSRTNMIILSMGSGAGGDAQYLFSEDVLGYTRERRPRHAKVYRDFQSEFDRLQTERIGAFSEFVADIENLAYPEDSHIVPIAGDQFAEFLSALPS